MKKIAIVTDSNCGILPEEAEKLGVHHIAMPFNINEEIFYENIDLTHEKFYEIQKSGTKISTSSAISKFSLNASKIAVI